MGQLKINAQRLQANLISLGNIANGGAKGFTRLAYSAEEKAAAEWLKQKLASLPVVVTQDRVGNVSAKWGDREQPAIAFGSHLDTVPEGGLFDGALGVVIGLECLETLIEAGYSPVVPLELIGFIGEEANALGGTFGSRAMAGLLPDSAVFTQQLQQRGFSRDDVAVTRSPDEFHAFLEIHIEQGPVLEAAKQSIGVVTAIAGILRLAVEVRGLASHSGTTPMHMRQDALLDAARLVQKVYEVAAATKGDVVATVGEIAIFPNLANVVPGSAHLTIEIRGQRWADMKQAAADIESWAAEQLTASFRVAVEKHPITLDRGLGEQITNVCIREDIPHMAMPSGANHDANSMSALTKVGMIFVPSKDGLSHHPDEYTAWEEIETGANVLLQTILSLSEQYKSQQ